MSTARSTSAGDFIHTNINGTFVLLEEARRHCDRLSPQTRAAFRFHHVSTDEVFGELGPTGKFTETTPYDPSSPYSASKAASDHLVRAWGRTYGLPVLLTNCSNNYGPYQFPEKLVPLMILRALKGETLPVYGAGDNVRDWLHVEDHAAALLTVLNKAEPGSTYNIGCSAERRNIDMVEDICDLVDDLAGPLASGPRRGLISFVADRPGHDKRYAIDASKVTAKLGWKPTYDLASGLRQTVQWYLDNESLVAPVGRGGQRSRTDWPESDRTDASWAEAGPSGRSSIFKSRRAGPKREPTSRRTDRQPLSPDLE